MPLLSDKEIAARLRRRNREGVLRMRERQREAGNVLLTGWVPKSAKARVEALAADQGMTMGEAMAAIIGAYNPPMDATTYLMSSPVNAARLTQAISDHRAGRNMQARELLPDAD